MDNIQYNQDIDFYDNNYDYYRKSIDDSKTQSFGKVKEVKFKKNNLLAKPQQVITAQFKVKCLKNSLKEKLLEGSREVNQIWNYCNDTSSKAIERRIWLSSFDLNKMMSGITYDEQNNPHGFKVLTASIASIISNEYVTRRNQFKKKKLRYRTSFGANRTHGWIPFKEENINISYNYDYIQRTEIIKEKLDKKTGEITTQTKIKEKKISKNLRVAGKNTPVENLYGFYAIDNDSTKDFGIPSILKEPTIKILGTHIKIFNSERLTYLLYYLGAKVLGGSFKENAIGDWYVNLTLSIDEDIYKEKHLQGKLKIPDIAPNEIIGLDPGTNGLVDDRGIVYTSSGKMSIEDYQLIEDLEIKIEKKKRYIKSIESSIKNIKKELKRISKNRNKNNSNNNIYTSSNNSFENKSLDIQKLQEKIETIKLEIKQLEEEFKLKEEKYPAFKGSYAKLEDKISLAQSRGKKEQVARLSLKAKNIREDNINKNTLDIIRKYQFIRVGDLKLKTVVKKKEIGLSQKDITKINKKNKSENKRQKGIDKREEKEEFLNKERNKNTTDKKKDISNNAKGNKNSKTKKNKKKRGGFGKSLLDQGLGKTKHRLGFICHITGRSFEVVDERYTTQVCSNCDHLTGPRGLGQLGIRQWVCSNCDHKHFRDQNSGNNMKRTDVLLQLVEEQRKNLASRSGMIVPVGENEL